MNYAALCALLGVSSLGSGAPVAYTIDPNHTHPEFEADHPLKPSLKVRFAGQQVAFLAVAFDVSQDEVVGEIPRVARPG